MRAANKVHRQIVVDLYVATILRAMGHYAKLPQPRGSSRSGLKVWFTQPTWPTLRDRHPRYNVDPVLKAARVFQRDVERMLPTFLLLVRPSMSSDLAKLNGLKDGLFVHSLWEGYERRPENGSFWKFFQARNFEKALIRASGHADLATLQSVAERLEPAKLVPIHTNRPKPYVSAFPETDVLVLEDGNPYSL